MYLITGAAGAVSGVSRTVVELLLENGEQVRGMVHRDDVRADRLRELGAEVVVGDLTRPKDVVAAMDGVSRIFFNMTVSLDYLQATAVVCAAALDRGGLEVVVNMSQMTVSQMTLTSTEESRQQRLHWLSEQIMNWSGVPVVHIRPTVFLDNPLFTLLDRRSVRERGVLALPFGTGRTSPIAASDVARVVTAVLKDPTDRIGDVYELTGPEVLDIHGLAAEFSRALGRPITAEDMPYDDWLRQCLRPSGLPDHVQQHIATMARLHREDRYNRATDDVERITGQPAQTVEDYIAGHLELFDDHPGGTNPPA
ncbi:MAG TPA: NAD(P)H-binding protein [Mycobacterium sp.]|nr:NAD(P)H-binding protein [Mycobacterium sp.]